jgi:hypothetical protein
VNCSNSRHVFISARAHVLIRTRAHASIPSRARVLVSARAHALIRTRLLVLGQRYAADMIHLSPALAIPGAARNLITEVHATSIGTTQQLFK